MAVKGPAPAPAAPKAAPVSHAAPAAPKSGNLAGVKH